MATKPLSDLTATWNAGGTTFTAVKMNVTDTASAAGSLLLDLQVGGVSRFKVDKTGRTEISTASVGTMYLGGAYNGLAVGNCAVNYNTSGFIAGSGGYQFGPSIDSRDLSLVRDAANTLAQRNGVNAQAFRIYNTFTDASNYERLNIGGTGGQFDIWTTNSGTGIARPIRVYTSGNTSIQFGTAGTIRWNVDGSTGHFLAAADNTYDIGASGANRPRNIYVGTLVQSLVLEAAAAGYIGFDARSRIRCPADGQILLRNNAENNFSLLQFGGSTSSFPSLKRNGTALETKLADDSAYAPHAAQYLDVTDGITAPGAATNRARIYVDSADGDLKVIFADGTIKTIVTDT